MRKTANFGERQRTNCCKNDIEPKRRKHGYNHEKAGFWGKNANGGERIRTPGTFRHNGFQDRHHQPLGHSSKFIYNKELCVCNSSGFSTNPHSLYTLLAGFARRFKGDYTRKFSAKCASFLQKIESFCKFLTVFDDFNLGLGGFSGILT